ncbi:class I SAM-dependent methyltransferase [Sediminicoccus sp. KRV36]|uniref:class I SAM-dependent methyltransferase n=1 Tax=Sediminicoccus sp. KRV36 TaxID=3133721 RepID=UPI00200FC739|nr:class I SAM-dependent methyltransferase [Sediminicoccus rosea]UPY37435.1 class I SAM-dependent methyltransferase [Sediminicoccus rosea]UPY38169.1 class I SAM-dependent methyltransferase [Sediminicoccus rosea]
MSHSCRFCAAPLTRVLVDLGHTALANSYVTPGTPGPDAAYELCARVCDACFLVQVADAVPAEAIFSDYAYFSSFSTGWLAHCEAYAAAMTARFGLGAGSRVVEIASNDGYLLQYFVGRGVPVLGIEPAANVAEAARARGVATEVAFFGRATGERLRAAGMTADLMASNNVLAHVPDINDFVSGVPLLLKPEGVWTIEFPHLLNLIALVQFDTIYHEHYSYLSLLFVEKLLAAHGLRVFDVEPQPTHGGSLRVFVCHAGASHVAMPGLAATRAREAAAGLDQPGAYDDFAPRVAKVRDDLLAFLREARAGGKTVAAYGAAAKGNTLLNFCGIASDLITYVVDKNPAKQGKLLPGSRLPVFGPEKLYETRPDYIVILPWNVAEEVVAQNPGVRDWGAQWVTAIPGLKLF